MDQVLLCMSSKQIIVFKIKFKFKYCKLFKNLRNKLMQNINMTLVDFKHLETFVLNSFLAMGLKNEDAKIFTCTNIFRIKVS